jgi:hypothetical protein
MGRGAANSAQYSTELAGAPSEGVNPQGLCLPLGDFLFWLPLTH